MSFVYCKYDMQIKIQAGVGEDKVSSRASFAWEDEERGKGENKE